MRALPGRQFSNVLHGMAAMEHRMAPATVAAAGARLAELLPDLGPHAVSNILWACGQTDQGLGPELLQGLSERVAAVGPRLNPQGVAIALSAYARMGHQPPQELLRQLVQRGHNLQPQASPGELASMVWALGRLVQQPREHASLHKFLARCCKNLQVWAKLLSNPCWVWIPCGESHEQMLCFHVGDARSL